jgi:hypothetical protein
VIFQPVGVLQKAQRIADSVVGEEPQPPLQQQQFLQVQLQPPQ